MSTAERIKDLVDRNRGRTIAEADISNKAKDIYLAIEIATRLLRETPDAEDYGFILAQFKRRWPSMDADDMGYALGYALGRLSERDRVLESMPAVTEGSLPQ